MKNPPSLCLALLLLAAPAFSQPFALAKPRFAGLLQTFVTHHYGRSFQALGDERDFDHGHVLFDKSGEALAVLYHTREDAPTAAGRSWLQWASTGKIEDAARFARKDYPRGGYWDWFVAQRLPALRERGTVTERMLDPELLAFDGARTAQWVFTRAACPAGKVSPDIIQTRLPGGTDVCLSLGSN
jgi:hypothetical protein